MSDVNDLQAALGGEWTLAGVVGTCPAWTAYAARRGAREARVLLFSTELSARLDAGRALAALDETARLFRDPVFRPVVAGGTTASGQLFVADSGVATPVGDLHADIPERMGPVCAALGAAHEAGGVHGLLHPAAFFLEDGRLRLGLVGIEAALRAGGMGAQEIIHATRAAPHASPEQQADLPPDARSDIFALGSTLYEAITGRPPFGGRTTTMVMAAVLSDEGAAATQSEPNAPQSVVEAVLRAVEQAPADRWPTMADFGHALAGEPAHAASTTAASRPRFGCLPIAIILSGAVTLASIVARVV